MIIRWKLINFIFLTQILLLKLRIISFVFCNKTINNISTLFRYTRNLVDAGNGKFNLMIICWGEGHGSAIHDHADSHCFMKMLKGELTEIRYAWPNTDSNDNIIENNCTADIAAEYRSESEYEGRELTELSRSVMETNSVHYINGKWNNKTIRFKKKIILFRKYFFYFILFFFFIVAQTLLDYTVLKIVVIRTVLCHCIFIAHHTIHVVFLIKKPASKQNAKLNFTACMDNEEIR